MKRTKAQLSAALINSEMDSSISEHDLMEMFVETAPDEWGVDMHAWQARDGLMKYGGEEISFGFLGHEYDCVDRYNAKMFMVLLTELCLRYHNVQLSHPKRLHPALTASSFVERNGKLTKIQASGGVPQVWGGSRQISSYDNLFDCALRSFLYYTSFDGYRSRRDPAFLTSDIENALEIVNLLKVMNRRGWRVTLKKHGFFDHSKFQDVIEWQTSAWNDDEDAGLEAQTVREWNSSLLSSLQALVVLLKSEERRK